MCLLARQVVAMLVRAFSPTANRHGLLPECARINWPHAINQTQSAKQRAEAFGLGEDGEPESRILSEGSHRRVDG